MPKDIKFINGKFVDPEDTFMIPKMAIEVADYLSKLVEFRSPNGVVESEGDWKIVNKLFEAFMFCYPMEYQDFIESSIKFKEDNMASKGFTKDKEMQHQAEIPQRFHELLKTFYPMQGYDKAFTRRLVEEIPVLKASI